MKRIALLVLPVLLAVTAVATAQSQKPLRPFTFILDFLPYGEYTPYFTALDKGWYREEGLDVKILRGAGSVDFDAAFGAPQVASRYAFTEEATGGKVAVGQFEPARVERSRDVYTEYLELKRRMPADELVTNDLLPDKK
jgi:hypothetical protein